MNQDGIYEARVLLSDGTELSDYRTLEIKMIQVNGEQLHDHSQLYYNAVGFADKVAFFLTEDLGWTYTAWEYDWNGKYLGTNSYDGKTLSEDIFMRLMMLAMQMKTSILNLIKLVCHNLKSEFMPGTILDATVS